MRRAAAPQISGVSLFPFLAVLVCAMGALIVLLVVITFISRQRAVAQAAQADPETAPDEAAIEAEDLQWRIAQLQAARDTTGAQLAEGRQQLSGLENHLRALEDRWKQLKRSAAALAAAGSLDQDRLRAAEAELLQLRAQIQRTQLDLEQASRDAQFKQASYAIVPYEGPNQTRRRPIYIECLGDRLVLQPEGVEFRKSDFQGDLGPANPLAAALRAARDYLVSQDQLTAEKLGDPYPLFVVRPNGIGAYNIGRQALSSWGSEFGYEFVEEDWKLAFPRPDLQLAEVEARAADEARRRIKAAIAYTPQAVARRARPIYRASPVRGGIMQENGSLSGDEAFLTQRNTIDRDRGQRQRAAPTLGQQLAEADRTAAKADRSEFRTGEAPGESPSADPKTRDAGPRRSASRSLAETRGKNWGLQDAAEPAVRITRPVHVECRSDQLIVLPEKGAAGGRSIALANRTEDSIDEFVSAIWDQTRGWGMAGPNMKWKPVLVLELGHGGEGRLADLETLMADSGLEVRRK